MEAQLAEAMAMMQEHPELNTPENRQILHKLRYSIQGGGGIKVKVQSEHGDFDGVLSVNKDGELELAGDSLQNPLPLKQFQLYNEREDEGEGEDEDESKMQDIPKDDAFLLSDDIALLVLVTIWSEPPYLIAFGPDDIKKLGGMPTDAYLQAQKDRGQIAEFKKIAASDEDLNFYDGAVGKPLRIAGEVGPTLYRYRRRDALIETHAKWVYTFFGKTPAFPL